jgi:hypothetical protein
MKHFLFINMVFAFIFSSCMEDKDINQNVLRKEPKTPVVVQPEQPDQPNSREEDEARLKEMLAAIVAMAESKECTNPEDWSYTAYGAKACGGPIGYIAYSKNIDVEKFLEKVSAFTQAQDEFNRKWEVISDCMMEAEPEKVDCVDGKPKFVYGF